MTAIESHVKQIHSCIKTVAVTTATKLQTSSADIFPRIPDIPDLASIYNRIAVCSQ